MAWASKIKDEKGAVTMKLKHNRHESMSVWQRIFSQSKSNGARYNGETMPIYKWNWPTGTYLQKCRSGRESPTKLATRHSRYSEGGEKLTV